MKDMMGRQHFLKNNIIKLWVNNRTRERRMKKHAIIMHPAPINRDVEIAR